MDYTEIFATPNELADFCMLTPQEQDALLADLAAKGKIQGEFICSLPPPEPPANRAV